MSVEQQLIQLALRPAGDGPVELIRLCLFDWAVCAWAGRDEPVAQKLAMLAGVEGDASVVGGGETSAPDAALINGTTGHALDYDDTHFDHIGHTSAVIMPAVLAIAESEMISDMTRVIEAALIGSEAAVRVGLWLGRDHYQIGFHQTATAGSIGAAVGCARLLGLSDVQIGHAIGLAATGASGLKGQFGTMGKPLNAGLAARCAVEAALWAQAGITSDVNGLSQFGETHLGQANDSAWDLDESWKINRISHKFHACCHGLHAMIEALRDVPSGVTALSIHTHPRWMSVCNVAKPDTGLACKFSYKMTAAMTLLGYDTADIANFSDEVAQTPNLIELMQRIEVQSDDSLSEMETRVEVQTEKDTHSLSHDLSAPLDLATREARLMQKARTVVGQAFADKLWAAVQGTDATTLATVLRD